MSSHECEEKTHLASEVETRRESRRESRTAARRRAVLAEVARIRKETAEMQLRNAQHEADCALLAAKLAQSNLAFYRKEHDIACQRVKELS